MFKLIITFIISVMSFNTLAYDVGSGDYTASQARNVQHIQRGTVLDVREVSIHQDNNGGFSGNAGSLIGGAIGAATGYSQGGRNSAIAATVLGALGAIAGNAVQNRTLDQKGLEIDVKLDSGDEIVVSQAADQQFYRGDTVRIINGNGAIRVTH
jgi:outer membrane lipoprotein SlyB